MIKVGDVVKYSIPEEGEEDLRFQVIEDRETRLLVELLGSNLTYPPRECLALEHFEYVTP